MFLDLALDYRRLQGVFPLTDEIRYFGPPTEPATYWTTALHTGLLRKFAVPPLSVSKVAESALRLLRDDAPIDLREAFEGLVREGTAARAVRGIEISVDGHRVTAWDVAQIELYGRLLHADFGKWQTSKRNPSLSQLPGLHEWCLSAANALRVLVIDLRVAIRLQMLATDRDLTRFDDDAQWALDGDMTESGDA